MLVGRHKQDLSLWEVFICKLGILTAADFEFSFLGSARPFTTCLLSSWQDFFFFLLSPLSTLSMCLMLFFNSYDHHFSHISEQGSRDMYAQCNSFSWMCCIFSKLTKWSYSFFLYCLYQCLSLITLPFLSFMIVLFIN